MNKKSVKGDLILIIAGIFMAALATCDNSINGGETALTIRSNGGNGRAAMPWPPDEAGILGDLNCEITLTGNGQTINRTAKGTDTISVTVSAGLWNVAIKAFYQGNLYATGSNSLDVKAGQNNRCTVTMNKAFPNTYYDITWYTSSSPYEISTAEQLAGLAHLVNSGIDFAGETITLTTNISLSAYGNWQPIGTWGSDPADQNPFAGAFDGNGNTISDLSIDIAGGYKGLFGFNSGTITNLGLIGGTVKIGAGNYNAGGIAGANSGTISNCYSTATVEGGIRVGGIAGRNDSTGIIINCYNTGNIKGGDNLVGGIVGNNYGSISYCYNTGNVTGTGTNVGGITGNSQGGADTVINCVSLGLTITSTAASTGRVIGGSTNATTRLGNYAREDMEVNGDTISVGTGTTSNNHGEDISTAEYNNESWWTSPAGFDLTATGAWIWNSATSLPILRGFKEVQNHTVP